MKKTGWEELGPVWAVHVTTAGGRVPTRVRAHTAGEARAAAKAGLGIPPKGRLPAGCYARRER